MKDIRDFGKKKISLNEIEKEFRVSSYNELYEITVQQIQQGNIEPVKASGLNGKKPALFNMYRILNRSVDYSGYQEELLYHMSTKLTIDYYQKHPDKYVEDRKFVQQLNRFYLKRGTLLNTRCSINERSFQIWGREKFLSEEGGKRILKNVGLSLSDLNIYETAEPIAYYVHDKTIPQNVLIVENKDTFVTIRKHLLEGASKVLNMSFGTIIYGGGKKGVKTFQEFELSVEPYLNHKENRFYYFGDLDFEGIIIYESLYHIFSEQHELHVFTKGYKAMLRMAEQRAKEDVPLPKTKAGQNRNIGEQFLSEFETDYIEQIMTILEKNDYIPQEILSETEL